MFILLGLMYKIRDIVGCGKATYHKQTLGKCIPGSEEDEYLELVL
jgi:hypothetical protein